MKKILKTSILLLLVFYSFSGIKAQNVYEFNKGLIAGPCHHYGREGIYTDQLVYLLYTGKLQTPKEDGVLYTDKQGEKIVWDTISTNDENIFKDERLSNGYLYLTYYAEKEGSALLNTTSNSTLFFNGIPHTGDVYGHKWMYIPVKIKKGLNELYIRTGRFSGYFGLTAKLVFLKKPVSLNTEDLTIADIVLGEKNTELWGALVIINQSDKPLSDLVLKSMINSNSISTNLPLIPPMATRKVGFKFHAGNINEKGSYDCIVKLMQNHKTIDELKITIEAVEPIEKYKNTFISDIDGSVQYYAVCPRVGDDSDTPALFLSVHGAGVEAIGQARAYQSKDWGVLVAPTNRRPRGFNWEDWGRIDAIEVLEIAKEKFNPDPSRIYLTGHSMGGHGTWYLGATYPEKWAAIAPCAAYPTLVQYGSADGNIPEYGENKIENILLQSSNGSKVIELAHNFGSEGIYILHGDSDKVVPIEYSREMRELLGTFHKDFSYYEYPGGSHWFGSESVDWPHIFEYFKWHSLPPDSMVNNIDFSTANPAISSGYYWASVVQQQEALKYSRIRLVRNKTNKTISGETENVSILGLRLSGFSIGDTLSFLIDNQLLNTILKETNQQIYLYSHGKWVIGTTPADDQKGVIRNGTFKEPFNNRMVFVYGTSGNTSENAWSYNKARFDAETWYYRGNGAVDIIPDKDFDPLAYSERSIIIYGNTETNSAWNKLLKDCPIQVTREYIKAGNQQFDGSDLGTYFIWPRFDCKKASVAVIAGTGLPGLNAANANQYFAGGSGFPDYMIFSVEMLKSGIEGIKSAGFYTNSWTIND